MDSVTSRSTHELLPATRATRMILVGVGQGIHLVATCLLNAQTSQMSVSEIYEWLAERYLRYQYTKSKIRHVLRHDSERKSPRFVVANKNRIAGVPLRWTIRPGMEPQLRRCFSGPPPTEPPIPQFYGGLSQLIHCVLCNRGFDRHESFVRHQREAHSSDASMSPATHEEIESVINTSTVSCEPRMGPKRAAGGVLLADQSPGKRRRISRRTTDRQHLGDELSSQGSTIEAADRNEAVRSPNIAIRENATLQQRIQDRSRRESTVDSNRNYKLYTKATIISKRRIVELERVKIDGSSLHSLLPRSIASKLGLSLHFGDSVIVKVANRTVAINQYCRFTIKVANTETTIDSCVVSEPSSLLLGWEWTQQVNLLSDLGNHTYYLPGPYGNLNKLPDPATVARAEAETEFATGAVVIREETLTVNEVPTATEDCERRRSEECELCELASVDESVTGDETIGDAAVFEDAVSRQSSDDDLYYVDRILAEKHEDGSTYYLILWDGYAEDESTWEPLQNIMDKKLLDVWRKRKMQEFYGMEPAFDLVKFEERQRSTFMHPCGQPTRSTAVP